MRVHKQTVLATLVMLTAIFLTAMLVTTSTPLP
jgi:hypothetical protein